MINHYYTITCDVCGTIMQTGDGSAPGELNEIHISLSLNGKTHTDEAHVCSTACARKKLMDTANEFHGMDS